MPRRGSEISLSTAKIYSNLEDGPSKSLGFPEKVQIARYRSVIDESLPSQPIPINTRRTLYPRDPQSQTETFVARGRRNAMCFRSSPPIFPSLDILRRGDLIVTPPRQGSGHGDDATAMERGRDRAAIPSATWTERTGEPTLASDWEAAHNSWNSRWPARRNFSQRTGSNMFSSIEGGMTIMKTIQHLVHNFPRMLPTPGYRHGS
jgi:hypothetical protein